MRLPSRESWRRPHRQRARPTKLTLKTKKVLAKVRTTWRPAPRFQRDTHAFSRSHSRVRIGHRRNGMQLATKIEAGAVRVTGAADQRPGIDSTLAESLRR